MDPQQTPPQPQIPPAGLQTPAQNPQALSPQISTSQALPAAPESSATAASAAPKSVDYQQQLLQGKKPYDEKDAQAYLALVTAETEQKNRHFSEAHTTGPGGKFIGRTLDTLRKLNPSNSTQPMSRGRRVLAWVIFVAAWAAVILIVVL